MGEVETFCWQGTDNFKEIKTISNPQLFNSTCPDLVVQFTRVLIKAPGKVEGNFKMS